MASTSHRDFTLSSDDTKPVGWYLEADIVIDEKYGKLHDVLTKTFKIPEDKLQHSFHMPLGTGHSWDFQPLVSGFLLESIANVAPKGSDPSGTAGSTSIDLGEGVTLSDIGIRLKGLGTYELGLGASKGMDFGYGVFGTLHLTVPGSIQPLALDFDIEDNDDTLELSAILQGDGWPNAFGTGLTVGNHFAHLIAHS